MQNCRRFFDAWAADQYMSVKSTVKSSGSYPLGTAPFRLPASYNLELVKKNNFSIINGILMYKEKNNYLVHTQDIFPRVNFKFYLMDSQGRYVMNIVEIKKTPEDILSDNNFRFKAYQLKNGDLAFKV